jgi:uncharacterized damage-inducible protein DinB
MEFLDQLRRLFDYDAWGNREALASLRACSAPPARAVAILGHVGGAQQVWLDRIHSRPDVARPWPELRLEELGARFEQLVAEWRAFLDALTPADLARRVTYTTTKGAAFDDALGDVLTHVAFHSAYHRGQVAALVRSAGHQPAQTDFIHAVRTGRVG